MGNVFRYEEHKSNSQIMKKFLCVAASLLALNLTPVFGQPGQTFQERLAAITRNAQYQPAGSAPALTKFNLDFPGGTPKELVAAIEKATTKPLNVIVGDEVANTKLPPIKVSEMDVAKLFQAISENSKKYSDNDVISQYGFTTQDNPPTDTSLWTFSAWTKATKLTRFSLNFPGGTPRELVAAIEKATGKSLNVIVADEDAATKLPPLKLNEVTFPMLSDTMRVGSFRTVYLRNYNQNYSTFETSFGFTKADGQVTSDNTVWFFTVKKAPTPGPVEKSCQFYSLSPYLDRGFTVDDITTAIQTGWKMAGITPTPDLNYHKETKLLIAYGEPDKLKTIADVLKTLPLSNVTAAEGVSYWKYIQGLQGQIDELKTKINSQNSSTNATAAEKTGK